MRLRCANLLTSAIGLPSGADAGVRLGTNEITRWGAEPADMDELAALLVRALTDEPASVAAAVTAWRGRFTDLRHVRRPV